MYGLLLTGGTSLQLDTFLGYGTSILEWMITSLGSIISFFVANPALLLWPIVALAGVVFVYFKKLVQYQRDECRSLAAASFRLEV